MELRWLHDFLAVADTRNFTEAAERRHVSQAALNRHLQQLEAWVGVRLVDRTVHPSCLTPQGERFVAQARETALQSLRPAGEFIRIALSPTLATHLLPAWWGQWFGARQPPGCLVLPTSLHDAVTALVAGTSDLLLCDVSPERPIPLEPGHYERKVLARDTLRPYASPALLSGLAGPAEAALRAGQLKLLLYPEGSYLDQVVAQACQALQAVVPSRPAFRSDTADVLCRMACAGHGVAWLPGCCAQEAVRQGTLVPLGDPAWSRELHYVACRDAENRNPALHDLWLRLPARGPAWPTAQA